MRTIRAPHRDKERNRHPTVPTHLQQNRSGPPGVATPRYVLPSPVGECASSGSSAARDDHRFPADVPTGRAQSVVARIPATRRTAEDGGGACARRLLVAVSGGLPAGVALGQAEATATVFEQAAELRPVGAGIVLAANGMAALARVGCDEAVRSSDCALQAFELRSRRGAVLMRYSLAAIEQDLGQPTVAIHRTDLHTILATRLGADRLRLGASLTRFDQTRDDVGVQFADKSTERSNVLIGADGVHSTVRAQLLRDGPARNAGYTAWRGVAPPGDASLPSDEAIGGFGRGSEVGIVPIGGDRYYWYATANLPADAAESPDGRKAELLRRFDGRFEPVQSVIEATDPDRILRNDIFERVPSDRWDPGRVTLLGDAAHPMTPNLGQGAGPAIEDAVVLEHCVAQDSDATGARRRYERRRMPRTAAVVRGSRVSGRLIPLENPMACFARDWLVRLMPARLFVRQARRVLTHQLDG